MYATVRSLLFALDAESAHRLSTGAARVAQATVPRLLRSMYDFDDEILRTRVWGIDFDNPVGLAAGFDKNAKLVPFWETLGFGFAEVGSVSAQRSKGNPRPRAFRLATDQALINRMGLNNQGAARIARRLQRFTDGRPLPLGINLAKTHDPTIEGDAAVDDFRTSFRLLAPLADYVALNISCPNTAEGKTFEDADALDALLRAIFEERRDLKSMVPILLKLSPPDTDRVVYDSVVETAVRLGRRYGVHGFIAANTASDRRGLDTPQADLERIGRGGLSGRPLADRATQLVRYLYRRTDGEMPIIGVGGVASGAAAYAKIRAGASLVQLYTGLVYEGPGLVQRIKQDLADRLRSDGFHSLHEAVGVDASVDFPEPNVSFRSESA